MEGNCETVANTCSVRDLSTVRAGNVICVSLLHRTVIFNFICKDVNIRNDFISLCLSFAIVSRISCSKISQIESQEVYKRIIV